MERLTERDEENKAFYYMCGSCPLPEDAYKAGVVGGPCHGCRQERINCEKLADYEDAEEEGRLIEFPVSLGQHLWYLNAYGIIRELTVNDLTVSPRGQAMLAESSEMISYYSLDHIGKNIFCTREEAEAKLKEMEDEQNE